MKNWRGRLLFEEDGATALECGIIGALIAIGLLASAVIMSTRMGGSFTSMASAISSGGL